MRHTFPACLLAAFALLLALPSAGHAQLVCEWSCSVTIYYDAEIYFDGTALVAQAYTEEDYNDAVGFTLGVYAEIDTPYFWSVMTSGSQYDIDYDNGGVEVDLWAWPEYSGTYYVLSENAVWDSWGDLLWWAETVDSVSVSVPNPRPAITSVSPVPWQAGNSYTVTVSGTGFGTNPSLQISGSGVTLNSYSCSPADVCDTTITASVTIDPGAPSENASVTVTSTGYGGSGFLGSPGESPTSGGYSVEVDPAPQLSCTPTSLTRGASVSCAVSSGTVTQWSFSAPGVTVSGPTGGSTWSGIMAVSGTVTATVGSGNLTKDITVNPRSNFSISTVTLPNPQYSQDGTPPMDTLQTPTLANPQPNMGESGYNFEFGIITTHISTGPNLGLAFVASLTDNGSYVWELNPGLTNPNAPFYQAQSGAYGTCWAGVAAITAAVQLHEFGVVPEPSHYTEIQDFLAISANNPATVAEGAIGGSDQTLQNAVQAAYQAARNAGIPEPQGGAALPSPINYPPYTICQ